VYIEVRQGKVKDGHFALPKEATSNSKGGKLKDEDSKEESQSAAVLVALQSLGGVGLA
jgi:hypothetical protein